MDLTTWFNLVLQDSCGISSESQQPDDKSNDRSDDQSDDEEKVNDAEDEDEDGGGWITPSNIRQVKMDCADWTSPADVTVGCLTTDFAMQVNRRHRRPQQPFSTNSLNVLSFRPERLDSDRTSRSVRQRDVDQAGKKLHPALSRLFQVGVGGCTCSLLQLMHCSTAF